VLYAKEGANVAVVDDRNAEEGKETERLIIEDIRHYSEPQSRHEDNHPPGGTESEDFDPDAPLGICHGKRTNCFAGSGKRLGRRAYQGGLSGIVDKRNAFAFRGRLFGMP
jgi:hypothetical protein